MARTALIVKLAAIGDVVMALPMVTALRSADPGVRISWMCGQTVVPLLKHVDGIDELIPVDEAALLAGSRVEKLRAGLETWRMVAGRRFDAVYIAHLDPRYQHLVWPIRTVLERSLGGDAANRRLVHGRSHSDEYVRLVTGLDDFRASAFPPPVVRVALSPSLEQRLRQFNPDGRPLVAVAPGGARNVARENPLRRWPLERYGQLVRILGEGDFRAVLIGDASDQWVRHAFEGSAALDLIGNTDLGALVALFRRCAAVVTHDSGPLHLARLAGARVIALLGPTPPTMLFRPDPKTTVRWPGAALPCAPCYNGQEFAACSSNLCMQMIDCESVIEALRALGTSSTIRAHASNDFQPLPEPRTT